MIISEEHIKAASVCVDRRIPFALVIPPGAMKSILFASLSDGESALEHGGKRFKPGFFASFFGDSPSEAVYIPAELTAGQLLDSDFIKTCGDMPEAETVAVDRSTDFMKYCSSLRELTATLKKNHGKTVISRLIAVDSTIDPIDAFRRYVDTAPGGTYRFVFYTPATGLWIGASPELLLSHKYGSGVFSTISLAGTRKPLDDMWDTKNRVEHDYVTDFIDFHFRNHNLETDIEPYSAVAFGNIEHLCEVISGRGETDPISLLDDLNPTPALCGFPVDQAFGNILSYEMHDRKCYGGMVGLADDDGFAAYVDLRSCLVTPCKNDTYRYNIYAGGGITEASDPLDEWNEAAAKARMLYRSVTDTDADESSDGLSFTGYDEAYSHTVR